MAQDVQRNTPNGLCVTTPCLAEPKKTGCLGLCAEHAAIKRAIKCFIYEVTIRHLRRGKLHISERCGFLDMRRLDLHTALKAFLSQILNSVFKDRGKVRSKTQEYDKSWNSDKIMRIDFLFAF